MPGAIEGFKLDDYDVVLSDSSSFAHGAVTKKLHICYCHTPARFLWTDPEYLGNQKYPKLFIWAGKLFLPWLKHWSFNAAQRPDYFIANSINVQNRIKNFYNRDSVVISPPVDTEFFKPIGEKKDYFFTVSRLEPYKKVDLIIKAFNETGFRLKIAGTGTMAGALKAISKPNIEFVGRVSDEELRKYYSEAKAFVFAANEDAGIVLLEAQACGTPVIAYGVGGALEVVKPGVTGELFSPQTVEALVDVVQHYDTAAYHSQLIREHVVQFDKKNFQEKIKRYVEEKVRLQVAGDRVQENI
jgi:glycosyltransferase involved in cell wall biosynthesis